MSIAPIITFKAGICDLNTSNGRHIVKPRSTPGYLYLYSEDELIHFCWRPRSAPHTEPELDLVMVPSDGNFIPYKPSGKEPATNGRVYALKFSSSSQRYLFYLQSKSQHEHGTPSWFSPRDLKLGEIVNSMLQGDEVDVRDELTNVSRRFSRDDDDDDEIMEDAEADDHDRSHSHDGTSGGTGLDTTDGGAREDSQNHGESSASGGRAAAEPDPSSVVHSLLQSLGGGQNQFQGIDNPFTTLQDLFSPSSTIPFVESADSKAIDNLLRFLPPSLLLLAQDNEDIPCDISSEITEAIMQSLNLSQKKSIIARVLRSPQFTQGLSSMTLALRDGGLPSISEALKIPVENGGFLRRGGVPVGGGNAVESFLKGVQRFVKGADEGERMETD